jgi:hypothetical protein
MLLFCLIFLITWNKVLSFQMKSTRAVVLAKISSISMEYIPDGMSKQQWEEIKRKEAEANKGY